MPNIQLDKIFQLRLNFKFWSNKNGAIEKYPRNDFNSNL